MIKHSSHTSIYMHIYKYVHISCDWLFKGPKSLLVVILEIRQIHGFKIKTKKQLIQVEKL